MRFLYWLRMMFVVDELWGMNLSLNEYIELHEWRKEQTKIWREKAKEKGNELIHK